MRPDEESIYVYKKNINQEARQEFGKGEGAQMNKQP
jgi:hypothetical protein